MSRPQVVSYTPSGGQPRWLGSLGQVRGLNYSSALPGGYDQLTCTLLRPPTFRSDALNPGRIIKVFCGTSCVWDGQMLEPTPSDQGWSINAQGTGNWAVEYVATYTGAWTQSNIMDIIVNGAISRGLRWINGGIGSPPTGWNQQAVDSGAQSVSDALNLFCSNGGMTWQVGRNNVLKVFNLPTTPNRLLVATGPVARTLGGNYNRIYLRYGATADTTGSPATYAVTSVDDTPSIQLFGSPLEDYVDISSAGVISQAAAQAVGNQILKRYQRAAYSGPFVVQQGQLLNKGGQPIDLATEIAGTVVQLLMTDFTYASEQVPGPVTFLVGNYQYDDDSQTATITPFQSLDETISSITNEPWVTHTTRADRRYAKESTQDAREAARRKARREKRHRARVEARKDRRQAARKKAKPTHHKRDAPPKHHKG